jgi:putative ABC transport system substrate-binding protein
MPNVAGNFVISPFERMMEVIRECMPNLRRVGTLFAPAEVNSVFYKDRMVEAARAQGIEVQAVGVSTVSEVADAALSMGSMNVEAICQISDNLSGSTFAPIAQAARKFGLPLFTFNTTHADQGSTIIVARDYYDGGRQAGLMAAKVMRGADPAGMPFEPVEKTQFIINLDNAKQAGLTIPRKLIDEADKVIGR